MWPDAVELIDAAIDMGDATRPKHAFARHNMQT
jgi:hypothetical protein